jgi:hypothetical protein
MFKSTAYYFAFLAVATTIVLTNGCESPTGSLEGKIEPVFGVAGITVIRQIAVTRDESKIFFIGYERDNPEGPGGLGAYDTKTHEVTWILNRDEIPFEFYLSPDDSQILCFNYYYDDSFIIPADGGEPVTVELDYGAFLRSWLYGTTVLMTEQESPDGPEFSGAGDFYAFTYDFVTGERNDVLHLPDDTPDCWSFEVGFTGTDDLTSAIVSIRSTFDLDTKSEKRLYDLTTGYYEIITLPYGAERLGRFSPDGSKIMSGDGGGTFKDNIGYIDVESWRYVKVTESSRYDRWPYWARNGDRIYFVGDDRVFRVDVE